MSAEEEIKISEDAILEDAIHIIVEREREGKETLDWLWARVNDIVHAQTIGVQE